MSLFSIVSGVRAFLGADTLPSLVPMKLELVSYRFQSLDRMFTLRTWLLTVYGISSYLHTGFPSDHCLLQAKIKVKLGAKIAKILRPPKLELIRGASVP